MCQIDHIVETLGRRRLAVALGVGTTAVSNAVVKGAFPASWFVVMTELCEAAEIDCPPALFNMRTAFPSPPSAPAAAEDRKHSRRMFP